MLRSRAPGGMQMAGGAAACVSSSRLVPSLRSNLWTQRTTEACHISSGTCSSVRRNNKWLTVPCAMFGLGGGKKEEEVKEAKAGDKKGVQEQSKDVSELVGQVFGPKFSLPNAIALAGAAFEAYLQPVGAEGFQERGINGTCVTFTDSTFLSDARQAVLHVELLRGTGLRPADLTGKSDPYAVLSVGSSQATSKVINQNLDPEWNQTFVLYVKDLAKDALKIRLYDKDLLTSDDDLGTAFIPLKSLELEKRKELTLELTGPGAQGEITLRVLPLRFSDHLLNTLTSDNIVMPEEAPTSGSEEEVAQEAGEQVLAAVDGVAKRSPPPPPSQAGPSIVLPGFDEMKSQVSKALDSLGLLDTKGGVSSEEVAANPWKVLARMAGSTNSSTWVPVAFVDNDDTDTQAWLYRSTETREAVVAFRGTEQVKWKDLATDLNLTPCSLNPERVDDGADMPLPMRILRAAVPTNDMMVHQGFLTAYDSIKPQVFSLLDTITGPTNNPLDVAPWRVYITGHSLGGALATLCAYELAVRRGPIRARQALTLYTYGAPRVGNRVFADAYDKVMPDSWRVTNSRDIIPSVPRLLGYAHVKHSVRLTEDGKITIQADPGEDVFGEGKGGLEVIQELAGQIKDQERSWEEVYEEIKVAELAILDRLVSGQALEEHMEDFYLSTLQQVVVASGTTSALAASAQDKSDKPPSA